MLIPREFGGDKIQGAAVALVSFFILQPVIHDAVNDAGEVVLEGAFAGLSFDNIGTDGIFMALCCSILCVLLFIWVYKKGWTIKMPKDVPPAVADSFAALRSSAIVLLVCFLIRIFFEFTPHLKLHRICVFTVLQTPMKGLGYSGGKRYLQLHVYIPLVLRYKRSCRNELCILHRQRINGRSAACI